MVRVTEAIVADGVLKPIEPLSLREQQRVRITVEGSLEPSSADREAGRQRFLAGMRKSRFKSADPYPTRDERHERQGA
jgi:predicted DNA-binding antitoxin AbrB/MazE fold protein